MPDYIDLHMHTTRSDGLKSPAELLDLVRQADLAAFAVTDHDTLDGYFDIRELLTDDDPELIVGIELSAQAERSDLHILGYLFDPENRDLRESLDAFTERRNLRSRQIVEKLKALGLDVPFAEVEKAAGKGVIGRPHIAEAMVSTGVISHYEQAFRKYIGNDGPAYVPKARLTPREAVSLLHKAGGVAVLAHPFIAEVHVHIPELVDCGLDGIEVYHYSHTAADVDRAKELARRYHLLSSGGSDYHAREARSARVGSQRVPARFLTELKDRANYIRGHL